MYARRLRRPASSFFLFGPRGTGKSTWIAGNFAGAPTYDLLNTRESLRPGGNGAFHRGLQRMRTELGADRVRCYGVYRGARPARWNDIDVLPVEDFLRRLWDGDIIA